MVIRDADVPLTTCWGCPRRTRPSPELSERTGYDCFDKERCDAYMAGLTNPVDPGYDFGASGDDGPIAA